eukprot:scaffold897_cov402-Prasinococcus_capsulatus_cf.AAC.28
MVTSKNGRCKYVQMENNKTARNDMDRAAVEPVVEAARQAAAMARNVALSVDAQEQEQTGNIGYEHSEVQGAGENAPQVQGSQVPFFPPPAASKAFMPEMPMSNTAQPYVTQTTLHQRVSHQPKLFDPTAASREQAARNAVEPKSDAEKIKPKQKRVSIAASICSFFKRALVVLILIIGVYFAHKFNLLSQISAIVDKVRHDTMVSTSGSPGAPSSLVVEHLATNQPVVQQQQKVQEDHRAHDNRGHDAAPTRTSAGQPQPPDPVGNADAELVMEDLVAEDRHSPPEPPPLPPPDAVFDVQEDEIHGQDVQGEHRVGDEVYEPPAGVGDDRSLGTWDQYPSGQAPLEVVAEGKPDVPDDTQHGMGSEPVNAADEGDMVETASETHDSDLNRTDEHPGQEDQSSVRLNDQQIDGDAEASAQHDPREDASDRAQQVAQEDRTGESIEEQGVSDTGSHGTEESRDEVRGGPPDPPSHPVAVDLPTETESARLQPDSTAELLMDDTVSEEGNQERFSSEPGAAGPHDRAEPERGSETSTRENPATVIDASSNSRESADTAYLEPPSPQGSQIEHPEHKTHEQSTDPASEVGPDKLPQAEQTKPSQAQRTVHQLKGKNANNPTGRQFGTPHNRPQHAHNLNRQRRGM